MKVIFPKCRQSSSARYRPAPPPFTLVMAFVGIVCPIFYFYPVIDDDYNNDFALSLRSWLKVPWDVIMFVLLPPLLFDAAFHVKFHVFLKWVHACTYDWGAIIP